MSGVGALLPSLSQRYYSKRQYAHGQGARQTALTPLVEDSTTLFEFQGRTIVRELPSEIICKKIYYRGSMFKARDVFDLAGTYVTLPDELLTAASSPFLISEVYDRVQLRIEGRTRAFEEEILEEVNPTEFGRSYMPDACELALEALDFMRSGPKPEV
ncbi:hypothetical protein [Rhizobium ruizarguesonis]|uniref:hypothetical protein n=1 Tax=Rhizobium ruizarguesonis TaxID=2081791 RepID=UPI00102FE5B5|nr:hypothetical protein [Rhizobium ruizarguesonis]TAY93618.1 hypothetical protein ELH85_10785 [Rhizobium ruizarguesonis]